MTFGVISNVQPQSMACLGSLYLQLLAFHGTIQCCGQQLSCQSCCIPLTSMLRHLLQNSRCNMGRVIIMLPDLFWHISFCARVYSLYTHLQCEDMQRPERTLSILSSFFLPGLTTPRQVVSCTQCKAPTLSNTFETVQH